MTRFHSSSTLTTSDGCDLHVVAHGRGPVVLLVHGFGSNLRRNWEGPLWIATLERAGYRVIAWDQRGHGKSDKLYDPERYHADRLADDAAEVLDATDADEACVFGYSMGASVSLRVALRHPDRVRALVLAGIGERFFPWLGGSERELETVARALEADDPSGLPRRALVYRQFAEKAGEDRRALAACWRRPRRIPTREELQSIRVPTLVVTGDLDQTTGSGEPVAGAIPGARYVELTGKDHMTAVGARESREAVLDFLEKLPA